MIAIARDSFNKQFSETKYQEFLRDINRKSNYEIPFRIAETPIFIGGDFKNKLLKASEEIINFLARPDYKQLMESLAFQ